MTSHLFKKSSAAGFTLIELLLYISLSGFILFSITTLLGSILFARIKNEIVTEIGLQGNHVMQMITQKARSAETIISPGIGASATQLSLAVSPAGLSPTIFDLVNGTIRIKEGIGQPIVLTNSRVIASNLSVQNLSRNGTPGTVRVQFTLRNANFSGTNQLLFEETFTGGATLRQP